MIDPISIAAWIYVIDNAIKLLVLSALIVYFLFMAWLLYLWNK